MVFPLQAEARPLTELSFVAANASSAADAPNTMTVYVELADNGELVLGIRFQSGHLCTLTASANGGYNPQTSCAPLS